MNAKKAKRFRKHADVLYAYQSFQGPLLKKTWRQFYRGLKRFAELNKDFDVPRYK